MSNLLGLRQMADRLGVEPFWLQIAADDGLVPHVKLGPSYLFNPDAVEAALAKRAAEERGKERQNG